VNKSGAIFGGCLSGAVTLVLATVLVSYGYDFLMSGYFDYKNLQHLASPDKTNYAHMFVNTNKRDQRAPYIGISISSENRLNRDYEFEVFMINPTNAYVRPTWIDNNTLEIKYYIDPAHDARISLNQPWSDVKANIVFTELHDKPEPCETNLTEAGRKP